jgi:hypothetical protein
MIVKYKVANKVLVDRHRCIEEIKTIIKNIEEKPIK